LTQNRVTDHRGYKSHDLKGCMDATSLEELMDGVAKVMQQMELEEAIAMDAGQGSIVAMQVNA
jgi:protein subunit release factor A